ncbi:MAG: ABC transporter substrate-binding protein [Oscillospiraceae bacterium]|nr:ABC transporter substrate-binding protein [Oscillospiraceae bacterium]
MKKLLALLLSLSMALSLAACGGTTNKNADQKAPAPSTGETTTDTTAPATTPDASTTTEPDAVVDNTLVEYYMQKADEVVVTDTHVTFTDDSGRGEITVAKNPKNAAVLYGSLACLWYEAGGVSPLLIGGKSSVSLYKEQIGRDITQDEGVTIVSESSSGSEWDIEAIIANNPDLIVCSMGMKGYASIGATAEAANIPVIAIQYDHVQDYLKWFKVFCNLSGHPELWDEVANATAEKIIEVVSKVPADVEVPKVAILGIVSGKLRAYGTEAAAGTILKELGGVNVFDDESAPFESVDIDLEQLYAAAPEIIVINQRGELGATQEQLNEVVGGNPVWDDLDAVKKGVIFLEKGLFHNKPNHRYQEAYLTMAQILYPETFSAE